MTYEIRLAALKLAREITPSNNPKTLIENAKLIEAHLLGAAEVPVHSILVEETKQRGPKKAEAPSPEAPKETSGVSDDVADLMAKGNVLLNVARNIGTTAALCNLAATQLLDGKRVMFFTNKSGHAIHAKDLILDQVKKQGALTAECEDRLTALTFRSMFTGRGEAQDIIIVDGLEFLPYGKETDFANAFIQISKHLVFAGTPSEEMGLFYDLWRSPNSFHKIALNWATPLFKPDDSRKKNHEILRDTLGEERFRNQFENTFRKATSI